MGVLRRVGGLGLREDNGNGEALSVKEIGQVKHRLDVALQWAWNQNQMSPSF